MKLLVTDNPEDLKIDEISMTVDDFCDIENHPWISSTDFDYIRIDLDKRIPSGYLSNMIGKKVIKPKINYKDINIGVIRLLAELYKEESAKLRFTQIKEPSKLPDVIQEMESRFEWNTL